MKHLVFIITLILQPFTGFSQTEMVIDARPTSIGYCNAPDDECNGDIISIAGTDVSGYLLQIYFKKNEMIKIKLFRNGELIEDIYSNGFNSVKTSRNIFLVSCTSFRLNKLFHNPTASNAVHRLSVDISFKTKKGRISFHYPEESRIYIYQFNLL
jgi:hypothetical protein